MLREFVEFELDNGIAHAHYNHDCGDEGAQGFFGISIVKSKARTGKDKLALFSNMGIGDENTHNIICEI